MISCLFNIWNHSLAGGILARGCEIIKHFIDLDFDWAQHSAYFHDARSVSCRGSERSGLTVMTAWLMLSSVPPRTPTLAHRPSKWFEERLQKAADGDNRNATTALVKITRCLIGFDAERNSENVSCLFASTLMLTVPHYSCPFLYSSCGYKFQTLWPSNLPREWLNMRIPIVEIHKI